MSSGDSGNSDPETKLKLDGTPDKRFKEVSRRAFSLSSFSLFLLHPLSRHSPIFLGQFRLSMLMAVVRAARRRRSR